MRGPKQFFSVARACSRLSLSSRAGAAACLCDQFIPKKNRIAVYSYLFKEGVAVVKKDRFKPKHDEVEVPNLEVMNLMKSLKSRGFVRETFNWQYLYFYLTNEGIEYLRDYLHLPAEIVPATLKKATAARPPTRAGGDDGPPRDRPPREGGDRDGGYRREGGGGFGRGGGREGGGGFGRGGGGFGRGGPPAGP